MIGPSPVNQAVLIGTDHTLTCRRGPDGAAGFITWEEDLDPIVTIFIDDQKLTSDPKYDNFYLDTGNLYDIVISKIEVPDEGSYTCRNTADPTSSQSVFIGVEGTCRDFTSYTLSEEISLVYLIYLFRLSL